MCFVWITQRASGLGAIVDRCEREDAMVAKRVGAAYRKLRSVSATAHFCSRQLSAGAGRDELWSCDIEPGAADSFCYANVRWKRAGRVRVGISHCERELAAAVVSAYAERSGVRADRAQCKEDDQNEGEWICDLGATVDHDRCFVMFGSHARTKAAARIFYCQRELAAVVDAAVAGMYEKRTAFDDVSAACTLEEHEEWDCEITLPSGRDRCDVRIERRDAGPRVDMSLTTCESGRV